MKGIKPRKSVRPRAQLTPLEITRLVADARDLFERAFADVAEASAGNGHGACLYWTACAIHVAHAKGIHLVPQAGTASFRRLLPSLDDGVVPTHFSYVYSDVEPARLRTLIEAGMLPEMHVWAGDPERQHVVDLSTATLATQCKAMTGYEWLDVTPPGYIWGRMLPEGWGYEPARKATILAAQLMERAALPKIIEAERLAKGPKQ